MTARPAIARLKVTLEDVEPTVMRQLDVPLKIRLDRLHLVLQAAWAGPTAISMSSRPAMSAGASLILTSTMTAGRERELIELAWAHRAAALKSRHEAGTDA